MPSLVRPKTMAHSGCSASQHLLELVQLVARLGLDHPLVDGVDRDLLRRHGDELRAVQLLLRQAADGRRHRRGEERRLAAPRRASQDRADVVDEAHRQHLVGLVQHHHAAVGEHHLAALQQVEHAAGRAHDDLRAAREPVDLLADRRAAVDGHHVHALLVGGERPGGVSHLQRQLARRAQHDRLQVARCGVDALQDGQHEGRGLAAARLGLADHVAVGEEVLDRPRLDWSGRFPPQLFERAEQRLGQLEVFELLSQVPAG